MFVTDRNINWKRQFLYIPAIGWKGGTSGVSTAPVTGSGFLGASVAGNASIPSTPVQGALILPYDVNPNFPLGFRVHFSSGTQTDLTVIQHKVLVDFAAAEGGTISATPATALDTVLASKTVSAGAGKSFYSPRGIKNAGFATIAQILAGYMMFFSVGVIAQTVTSDALVNIMSGLMLDYVPMRTRRPHTDAADCPQDDQ